MPLPDELPVADAPLFIIGVVGLSGIPVSPAEPRIPLEVRPDLSEPESELETPEVELWANALPAHDIAAAKKIAVE